MEILWTSITARAVRFKMPWISIIYGKTPTGIRLWFDVLRFLVELSSTKEVKPIRLFFPFWFFFFFLFSFFFFSFSLFSSGSHARKVTPWTWFDIPSGKSLPWSVMRDKRNDVWIQELIQRPPETRLLRSRQSWITHPSVQFSPKGCGDWSP